MPKKRDTTPAPDRIQFVERLIKCSKRERSDRAFAKKAGVQPSTFRSYLRNVEPPRHVLIRIANAAGVNVGWLVDESQPETGDRPIVQALSKLDLTAFRKNLAHIITKSPSELPAVAKEIGIKSERLEQLSREGEPTIDELLALCIGLRDVPTILQENFGIPAQDTVTGTDTTAAAVAKADAAGAKKVAVVGDETFTKLSAKDATTMYGIVEAMARMVGLTDIVRFVQPDELMSPTLDQGDMAIAVQKNQITGSGLYLFQSEKRTFVARATVTPDDRILLSHDHPDHKNNGSVEFTAMKYKCIGPVLLKVMRLKKPGLTTPEQ